MLISIRDNNSDIRSGITDVSGLGRSDINRTLLVRMKYLFNIDDNGHLLYRKRIYVPHYIPLKLWLIRDFYETLAVGHPR